MDALIRKSEARTEAAKRHHGGSAIAEIAQAKPENLATQCCNRRRSIRQHAGRRTELLAAMMCL